MAGTAQNPETANNFCPRVISNFQNASFLYHGIICPATVRDPALAGERLQLRGSHISPNDTSVWFLSRTDGIHANLSFSDCGRSSEIGGTTFIIERSCIMPILPARASDLYHAARVAANIEHPAPCGLTTGILQNQRRRSRLRL